MAPRKRLAGAVFRGESEPDYEDCSLFVAEIDESLLQRQGRTTKSRRRAAKGEPNRRNRLIPLLNPHRACGNETVCLLHPQSYLSKVRNQISRTEIFDGWLSISNPIRPGWLFTESLLSSMNTAISWPFMMCIITPPRAMTS